MEFVLRYEHTVGSSLHLLIALWDLSVVSTAVVSHSAVVFTGDFQFRAVLSKVVVVFMYRSLCRYVFSGSRISSSKETCHLTSFY